MPNSSKIRDPRFWRRWRISGAVGRARFNQQNHPEIRLGEVFITNASPTSCFVGWKSVRIGEVAYGSDGLPLGNRWPFSFPVFAQRRELEEAGVPMVTR